MSSRFHRSKMVLTLKIIDLLVLITQRVSFLLSAKTFHPRFIHPPSLFFPFLLLLFSMFASSVIKKCVSTMRMKKKDTEAYDEIVRC